jgi:hypothetical protein
VKEAYMNPTSEQGRPKRSVLKNARTESFALA